MVETRVERRPVGLLGIIILSLLIPACSSPNGAPHPWLRPFSSDANVVQRPTYEMPREKTVLSERVCRGRIMTRPFEAGLSGQTPPDPRLRASPMSRSGKARGTRNDRLDTLALVH